MHKMNHVFSSPDLASLKYEIKDQGFVANLYCKHAMRSTGHFSQGPGVISTVSYKLFGQAEITVDARIEMPMLCAFE